MADVKAKKTTKVKKSTKATAKPKKVVTPKVEVEETEQPMDFNNKPKNQWLWYGATGVVVAAVVLANILPSQYTGGSSMPSQVPFVDVNDPAIDAEVSVHVDKMETEVKSVAELETLLEKNAEAVSGALDEVFNREKRTIEQLDGIAKTALGLDARLQQLQNELATLQAEKEVEKKVQDPGHIFLGQMMIFLTDSYHRGQVTHTQLNELINYSQNVLGNADLVQTTTALKAITPDEGPVTQGELSVLTFALMQKGVPEVEDLMQVKDTEQGYMAEAKRYLSDWIQVKKIDQVNAEGEHPWMSKMLEVQQLLARGKVEKAHAILNEDELFQRDTRTNELKTKINLYKEQQKALAAVLKAYSQIYVVKGN